VIEDNQVVECNEAAIKALGYTSRRELLHLHLSKISPPVQADGEDSFSKAERMMSLAGKNGVHRFEWIHTKADGSNFDVEVALSSIVVDDRTIIHCIWRDISERQQTQSMLNNGRVKLRSIFSKVAEPLFVNDNEHRLVLANKAFYAMFAMDKSLVDEWQRKVEKAIDTNQKGDILKVNEAFCRITGFPRTMWSAKTQGFFSRGDRIPISIETCGPVSATPGAGRRKSGIVKKMAASFRNS
ncbi:MAG: PAS domain S-box-containing protein, partial [Congregibacter sp.]